MKRTPFLIAWVLSLVIATVAVAQEAGMQPEPGVVVVRHFQCSEQDEAVELLNGTWRSVVEELIAEGELVDYGILTHFWGDEWNVLDYTVAEDLVTFHQAIETAFERVGERVPEEEQGRFAEVCGAHKDNIYQVVQPPSEEEQSGEGEG